MFHRKTCQEMWVYTPEGRMIRQDDLTQDTLAAKATKECDTAMFQALIGENGPLCCGALPSVKSIPESGAKKIFQALDEERKQVEKTKTEKRKKEEESKELEPKTPEELGPQCSHEHQDCYLFNFLVPFSQLFFIEHSKQQKHVRGRQLVRPYIHTS